MTHPGELVMRRFLAEESLDVTLTTHLRDCAACLGRLELLRSEQRAFETEIPFERFAAGVEKAVRVQRKQAAPSSPNLRAVLALAAAFVLLAGAQLIFGRPVENRIKGGGGSVEFVVAGVAGQRNAAPVETLAVGERVRIGVSGHRYAVAISIDESGEVTTLYSEAVEGTARVWLPDSIEFTGTGREHLVVVLSDEAIAPELISNQLRERFARSRDLSQLGTLDVPGVQVHRTFIKP
ncbi:MAG: ACP synthase [Archangium sp.]